jgi:hypothetical protein
LDKPLPHHAIPRSYSTIQQWQSYMETPHMLDCQLSIYAAIQSPAPVLAEMSLPLVELSWRSLPDKPASKTPRPPPRAM